VISIKFGQYLNSERILDIESESFEGALRELVLACNVDGSIAAEKVVTALLEHEKTITTCIGNSVAVPHARLDADIPITLAFGRCKNGLPDDTSDEYKNIKYIMLMLSANGERSYLNVLTGVVRALQSGVVIDNFNHTHSLDSFQEKVLDVFAPKKKRFQESDNEINKFFLEEACKLAHASECSTVMIFDGTNLDGIDAEEIFDDLKIVITAPKTSGLETISTNAQIIVPLNANSTHWLYEFRSAILLGLSREIVKHDEKICCIGSNSQNGNFDTIFIIDVKREFRPIFTSETQFLTKNIKPEVLERVLSIASEISVEGREGKSVGCLFVIGDVEKIMTFSKPLVLNPFFGYEEEDRNILNPFMDETIKEFSLIDGAFVIRGDGVIESAGTLINTPDHNVVMPSGFGTRHAAAASISWAAECIAIAVSESTHRVTLFQNGQMLPIVRKD
jgi:DNA integrity scanning protein DisA with diadenylate cyclase activity/mannitol/fructose-specific phosphotransferase system IIA component (Ntr-type)